MSIQFSFSLTILVICIVAGGLGAFAHWIAGKGGWPGWLGDWFMLTVALLVFAVLAIKGG